MKKRISIKITIIIVLIILMTLSSMIPMGIGNKLNIPNDKIIVKRHGILNYNYSEFSTDDQSIFNKYNNDLKSNKNTINIKKIFSNAFIEGPWPMYCHDVRHTSRSPHSTADNSGIEKWRFDTIAECSGSPIIDDQGVIYIGSFYGMFAINPNGTQKWKFRTDGIIVSASAIDENGILYFGTIWDEYLFAIYSDNGTEKWKYPIGYTWASPTVGPDGIIYVPATDNWNVLAFYSNGTLKWGFHANERVFSSPAIGSDGTIYCTSYGNYLYALYPDNGTVIWQYNAGGSIRTSPCIADDGTIYVVSVNGPLHAVYPNGTMKWQTNVGGGTSPTIGQDGTIYCGYNDLYAINPVNGSVKWVFDPGEGRTIKDGTPCNSVDGTIFFGTYIGDYDGGELIAVNPDGTELWRIMLATDWIMSAPAIGSDGTVYVGSSNDGPPYGWGFLHAVGKGPLEAEADGPYYSLINQPVQFTGSTSGGYRPYTWHWNFGDGQTSTLQNPTHSYTNPGNYTVTLTVTDDSDNTSSDTTWAKIKESNNPPTKPSISGETNGETGKMYYYTFVSTDPDNDEYLHYYIDWGDGENSGWKGPYAPGEDAGWGHSWDLWRTYTIKAKARDNYGAESDWGTLSVTMPLNLQISQSSGQQINHQSSNQLLLKMMQRLLQNMK
jgi:outer membrane protein assembly factor BamB